MIEFADEEVVPIKELVLLYESVGWLLYAADPDALARAVDRSSIVITARDDDGELVGLARALTDEVSVLVVQEVLVRPERQREGIGSELVRRCLAAHPSIGRVIANTAGEEFQTTFAKTLGFTELTTGLVLER